MGGVEPLLMARWKARVEFLLSVIELLLLSLAVEALQGKMCQNSLPSGGGRSLGAKISAGMGRPWRIFFGFYKTRHILLSDSANCTMLRAIVLTQYRRVTDRRTDRQTDGIAIASTVLAMRALRHAVKMTWAFPSPLPPNMFQTLSVPLVAQLMFFLLLLRSHRGTPAETGGNLSTNVHEPHIFYIHPYCCFQISYLLLSLGISGLWGLSGSLNISLSLLHLINVLIICCFTHCLKSGGNSQCIL